MQESLNLLTDLVAGARKAGATAADALMYESASLSVSRRMGKPEGLERSESLGLSLRIFDGNRSAMVSSSDKGTEALKELINRGLAMARLAPEDAYVTLAPSDLLAVSVPELDLVDANEPAPEWLQEQCALAEDAALGTPGITNSEGADASCSHSHFMLVTSNGFAKSYRTSHSSISVSVLAGEGTGMERDYDFSSARHLADLSPAADLGRNAARRALARLGARKMATGQFPVIFDPRVGRSLLGSFSGAVNGAAVARGTSFLKNDMGKALFAPGVTIVDDPHRVRGQASRPFDGEGVANGRRVIVQDGTLQSWFLDVRSAGKLGLKTTGHASRSLSSPPSPSSTNLYIAAGTVTPMQLMQDITSGFYVTEVFGMGVNLVTGDYSQGASGFWIEKGQIAYPVSEVTIAGRLRDMFASAIPADDLEFRYGTNAPTLRIEGMTVAGT